MTTEPVHGHHPVCWHVWAIHEAFRRLGFPADDIWVHPDRAGTVAVVLKTQGKTFPVLVGPSGMTQADFIDAWHTFATAVSEHRLSQSVLMEQWEASYAKADSVGFIAAILDAGFRLPYQDEETPPGADVN